MSKSEFTKKYEERLAKKCVLHNKDGADAFSDVIRKVIDEKNSKEKAILGKVTELMKALRSFEYEKSKRQTVTAAMEENSDLNLNHTMTFVKAMER